MDPSLLLSNIGTDMRQCIGNTNVEINIEIIRNRPYHELSLYYGNKDELIFAKCPISLKQLIANNPSESIEKPVICQKQVYEYEMLMRAIAGTKKIPHTDGNPELKDLKRLVVDIHMIEKYQQINQDSD